MNKILNLININKEWIFSGIGITLLVSLYSIIRAIFFKNTKEKSISCNIKDGDGSVVIQGNNNNVNNIIRKNESNIKIVDINIDDFDEESGYPILEIKVRNTGDTVAFLKEIQFNILDYFEMENPRNIHYSKVNSTFQYDVLLSNNQVQRMKIAQAISPNDVDMFTIKIASSHDEPLMPVIYDMNLTIIYDESNRFVESERFIIPVKSTQIILGSFSSNVSFERARKNYFKLKEIFELGIKTNEAFKSIYESYESSKDNFLDVE